MTYTILFYMDIENIAHLFIAKNLLMNMKFPLRKLRIIIFTDIIYIYI